MSWTSERFARIKAWEASREFEDFIDEAAIHQTIDATKNPSKERVLEIIEKARNNATTGKMLSPEETATLLNIVDVSLWDEVFKAATYIKEEVYGNRIVLFSPLYISNPCVNNCHYCGFKSSNDAMSKKTLNNTELAEEIHALLDAGQKRLIAVYGEHPRSDYKYIAQSVRTIYETKKDNTEIRRVNINAAPMFEEEYQAIKAEGIGTYQVFQETYHKETYEKMHPKGTLKGEYDWRLFALHRGLKAGLDDVAVGVLFGLYDWKFEMLAMLHHAMDLERVFGIGPHTMSFPRIKRTSDTDLNEFPYAMSDEDFMRAVAVIRLMCPFTGMILTAREEPELRDEMLKKCGISQMDAGTNIGIGGYKKHEDGNDLSIQQFAIGDHRGIDDFILSLIKEERLPSFCTSCYREGRTGCDFMPLAKNASIKHLCIPNGILTFKEYMRDYASPEVKRIGERIIIPKYLGMLRENLPLLADKVEDMLCGLEQGKNDCHL